MDFIAPALQIFTLRTTSSLISEMVRRWRLFHLNRLTSFPSKAHKLHTEPVGRFFSTTDRLSVTIDARFLAFVLYTIRACSIDAVLE